MRDDDEKLYKLSQVATAAGYTLRTVQNHVNKGALPVRRVGPFKRPRVTESALREYLDDTDDKVK